MTNGDKKKKGRKINEETESEVLSSDAGSAVLKSPDVDQVSESFTNLTNSFSSHTDPDQQPETDDFYQIPSLSSVIIQRYEGERCKGQFHGEGVAYFQGGHVYKGMFSEGLMHGYGVYTWADGVKYEGEFESNMLMGRGRYTWRDGSSYEGEVYNAICHGTGTHICANTVVYTGQWHQGRRHGKGTMYYDKDKSSWYKGDWVNNNKEGWGLRCYPSGDIYEGEWRNNVRHGQGTMRWLKLAQQYSGTWQNGVQYGQGVHMWLLRRVHGSQYPQRNEYRGNFVQGQRHGKGTFYYAGGARYDGEWKNNKKHGKGKFTHRNGHVFEGEFADDQMVTPALSGIRPHPTNDLFTLVPDMALNIESLLEKIPQTQGNMERQQVEFVIMRHNAALRSIYSFYSRLGKAQSPDNTFLLTRLQLWRLLKDCNVHHRGVTLAQIHSPFTAILLRTLLSCLVMVAYHAYHTDMASTKNILASCFSKLMEDNILPNAKNVKGFLFIHPLRVVVAQNYLERCWEIYQAYCVVKPPPLADQTMTYRRLVWMFKDFGLLDTKLTPVKLLEIITAENINPSNPSYCNLDLEITFLEFFEVLLGCAEVKCQQVVESSQEDRRQSSPEPEARRDSPVHETSSSSTLQTTSCTSQSVRFFLLKLQEHLQFSDSKETEAQKNVNTAVKSQTAGAS
uniref:Radial spoke head 10 homolog B n=1 Tax=Myripristis murdjan TaxID=586833 RepID=A0A668ALE6_9TELE